MNTTNNNNGEQQQQREKGKNSSNGFLRLSLPGNIPGAIQVDLNMVDICTIATYNLNDNILSIIIIIIIIMLYCGITLTG